MYKLGIDVGGTNTDAVLIDEDLNVVAAVKNPTSGDIYDGHHGRGGRRAGRQASVDRAQIAQAMLGTTQCTNAIVERKGLAPDRHPAHRRAGYRGHPAAWSTGPTTMRHAVCVDLLIIDGGFEFDGKRLAEFDEAACRAFFEGVKRRVESVAVSSVFSAVRNDDELRAAAIAARGAGRGRARVHLAARSARWA